MRDGISLRAHTQGKKLSIIALGDCSPRLLAKPLHALVKLAYLVCSLPALARDDGTSDLLPAVMVMGIEIAPAALCSRAVCLLAAPLLLLRKTPVFCSRSLPCMERCVMLLHLLLPHGTVVARPYLHAIPLEAEAEDRQLIKEHSVMGDQKSYAREIPERLCEQHPRQCIEMVCWLVQDQHIGYCSQGAGYLHAFLLA